jgi:polysaccharide biosynthesis PFTS motif protein
MIKQIVLKFKERLIRRIEIQAVKGYFDIQETNSDLIHEIRNKIANHQLKVQRSVIENIIFPKNINVQLSLHQYLLQTLLGTMFNRVILFSIHRNKNIIYPLPIPWLRIIESSGLKVSYFWSCCFFYLFVLFSFLAGFLSLFKHIFKHSKRVKIDQKYSYFFNLDKECFSSPEDKDSHDIINWYTKKYSVSISDESKLIVHSVSNISNYVMGEHNIMYAQDYFPRISFLSFYFKFLPAVVITTLAIILTFRLRNIILLKEIIDMYAFKFGDKNSIAQKYFFSFTNLLYRPLWTYITELKGSSLIFYLYACNISNYKESNKEYSTVPEFFQVFNWPKYLVWNKHHAEYIRKLIVYPSDIEVVGPIGYSDNSIALPKLNKPAVLVFDIQPFKLTYSIPVSCGAQSHRYNYKVRVDFYNDIQDICNELGVDLFFKRKKNNPRTHKRYLSFIKYFIKNDNVVEIDPGVSAFRLCKQFDVVLSMPFTSTAVLADYYGKKSIYYDPSGDIQKDDRAAHNLTVISGKIELKNYLYNLFGTQ